MPETADELATATSAAEHAGTLVLDGWRRIEEVSLKGAIDLVTQYDLDAERSIMDAIAKAFPNDTIVGEENSGSATADTAAATNPRDTTHSSDRDATTQRTIAAPNRISLDTNATPPRNDRVWYVDPIDGTTNFAHGHPFFCISIAMYAGGDAQVGVVHAPALGVTWKSARGQGATRNGSPCRVSTRSELAQALCATGFPYDRWTNPNNNIREFEQFLGRVRGIRRCGSAAIDLALVADGTYDIYWERGLQAWDMCAGALLVEEAGGQTSTLRGDRADPRSGELLATNGALHGPALSVLGDARSKRSFSVASPEKS